MFKVGLDTSALDESFKEHSARGIGRYVSELDKYFSSFQDEEIEVSTFNHASFLKSSALSKMIDAVPLGRRTLKQQMLFPMKMSFSLSMKQDVIHFPAHMDAPSWCRKKCIVTVLDLIPMVLRDLYKAENPGLRFKVARALECRAIQNASLIIAISENTALDASRLLGIPCEKIMVTPLGVDESFFSASLIEEETEVRARYSIPTRKKVLLYVGGIDPRKNWKGLLRVFKQVVERHRENKLTEPVLVMAGKIETDRQYPKLIEYIKELDLEKDVVMTGYVPDQDLLQLYALSSVFCFMSLYEGFGLPLLEAMAAGLPVVSSNTSSMPEVAGQAALLVNPFEEDLAAQEISRILRDRNLAQELSEKGKKRAELFSWEKTGEATLEAYRKAAEMMGK